MYEVKLVKLRSLGKAIDVHWFDAGHVMDHNEQNLRDQEIRFRFVYQVLQQQRR